MQQHSNNKAKIAIFSPNWLGDCVMALPAIKCFIDPNANITIFAKPSTSAFWKLFLPGIAVTELKGSFFEQIKTVRSEGRFATGYLLNHTERSTLLAIFGKFQRTVSSPGRLRSLLMDKIVPESLNSHQSYRYFELLNPEELDDYQKCLKKHNNPLATVVDRSSREIAFFPGAARGVSKKWPAARFAELGNELARQGYSVVLMGAKNDLETCQEIAELSEGQNFEILSGSSLSQSVERLKRMRLAVSNDSGGMHLASLIGIPTVAIFGKTDFSITGPIGPISKIIHAPNVQTSRVISADDKEAVTALYAISTEQVLTACQELLEESAKS